MNNDMRIAWVISVLVGYIAFELALKYLGGRK